jgi:hypothetical protein
MNLKKILILPVAFILVHILYIGCCKCLQGVFHREISSLRVFELSHSNLNLMDTVHVADTLFSSIGINYNHVAKNNVNLFSPLVNSAYATRCDCEGFIDSGFKYKLDSLVIISNATFKGIPAGNNITTYFTGVFYTYNGGSSGNISYLPVSRLIDSLNANRNYYQVNLFTTATGLAEKIHRLKYALYSNGKIYEGSSGKILVWQ